MGILRPWFPLDEAVHTEDIVVGPVLYVIFDPVLGLSPLGSL